MTDKTLTTTTLPTRPQGKKPRKGTQDMSLNPAPPGWAYRLQGSEPVKFVPPGWDCKVGPAEWLPVLGWVRDDAGEWLPLVWYLQTSSLVGAYCDGFMVAPWLRT